jgi:hypothetical protein
MNMHYFQTVLLFGAKVPLNQIINEISFVNQLGLNISILK